MSYPFFPIIGLDISHWVDIPRDGRLDPFTPLASLLLGTCGPHRATRSAREPPSTLVPIGDTTQDCYHPLPPWHYVMRSGAQVRPFMNPFLSPVSAVDGSTTSRPRARDKVGRRPTDERVTSGFCGPNKIREERPESTPASRDR